MPHKVTIAPIIEEWFTQKEWKIRDYQQQMVNAYEKQESTLLIAPTGGGKTFAGFLGSLNDLTQNEFDGLHTLYISPLKALTHDIERNLITPIEQMGLDIRVESRTGDTPSHKRKRQREKPPHILLITPESLMLMLSYADAPKIFGKLKCVILDEAHILAPNKRGDFTALALARLQSLAPNHTRFGLSATVAKPHALAAWLGITGEPTKLLQVESTSRPKVEILESSNHIPYGGYIARYAIKEIYASIKQAKTSIIFVNTRSQAELMFQNLWDANKDGIPIAIYHGSLSKEQRRKTENLMAQGMLKSVVATSALELGIDWGDVELVIQIGAPKGIGRLLQRIGRSNHRMDEPSKALLVPANRFEVLECHAAIEGIREGTMDGDPLLSGSEDVLVQYILNCACSGPISADSLYEEVTNASPYQSLSREGFQRLFDFVKHGGHVLKEYERYHRLVETEDHRYKTASRAITQRHRQNIGVIVEAARLKVMRMNRKRGGRYIGHVEEAFVQLLTPGDTFFFAGEVLEYLRVRDMVMEVRPATAKEPKVPTYAGGQMPLSTYLANGVRALLDKTEQWAKLPSSIQKWLTLQQQFSALPSKDQILVEHFPRRKRYFTILYSFEGRKANQTLGMLMTRRMERMGLKPLNFSVTDYALCIMGLKEIPEESLAELFSTDILLDELEDWIIDSPMLKRSFRRVAMIAGLTEQNYAGERKSLRQVTFSTDLIYDVLRRHDPHHVLLTITRSDAERDLLDLKRLADLLIRFQGSLSFQSLTKPSPLSIPIVMDARRETIIGEGLNALLDEVSYQEEAEQMIEDIRADIR
jgi:ATP-dependent Lhr-like helicase